MSYPYNLCFESEKEIYQVSISSSTSLDKKSRILQVHFPTACSFVIDKIFIDKKTFTLGKKAEDIKCTENHFVRMIKEQESLLENLDLLEKEVLKAQVLVQSFLTSKEEKAVQVDYQPGDLLDEFVEKQSMIDGKIVECVKVQQSTNDCLEKISLKQNISGDSRQLAQDKNDEKESFQDKKQEKNQDNTQESPQKKIFQPLSNQVFQNSGWPQTNSPKSQSQSACKKRVQNASLACENKENLEVKSEVRPGDVEKSEKKRDQKAQQKEQVNKSHPQEKDSETPYKWPEQPVIISTSKPKPTKIFEKPGERFCLYQAQQKLQSWEKNETSALSNWQTRKLVASQIKLLVKQLNQDLEPNDLVFEQETGSEHIKIKCSASKNWKECEAFYFFRKLDHTSQYGQPLYLYSLPKSKVYHSCKAHDITDCNQQAK